MRRALLILAPIIAIAVIVLTWDDTATETTHAAGPGPAPIMALEVKDGGTGTCHSNAQQPPPGLDKCLIQKGSSFTLSVELKATPPGGGYIGFQTLVRWSGQPTKLQLNYLDSVIVWPDSSLPMQDILPNQAAHADVTSFGPPFPISVYKGNLVDLFFECKPGESEENIKFDLVSLFDETGGSALSDEFGDPIPVEPASLKIACVPPPAQDGQININVVDADNQSQKLSDTCWVIVNLPFFEIVSDNNAKPAACDDVMPPDLGGLSDKDPAAGKIAITIPAATIAALGPIFGIQQWQAPANYNADTNNYVCTLSGGSKKLPPNDALIACDEADPFVIKNVAKKQPFPGDSDGDGCADVSENRVKAEVALGGGRDWQNPWDYYDVDGDGKIDLFGDILGVINHFSLDGLGLYNVIYDRGPAPPPPANMWEMTGPDGVIDLFTDILGVITQFTLTGCTDPGP